MAGLTFEIVWIRALGLSLGANVLAVATTTAAYMGGLAIGGHVGGRIADRLRRPLSVYGILEVSLGLSAVPILAVARAIPQLDGFILHELSSGFVRALLRFILAFGLLLIPTAAMGMTLPILARAVTRHVAEVGKQVGSLYAINLLGAVVGAGLSGFFLLPYLGLWRTNGAAAATDLVLGMAAVLIGLRLQPSVAPGSATRAPSGVWQAGQRRLVGLLAVTGAAAMALQVLWTRALGTALGPSTYAFSAIVCAYLAGLAGGGFLAAGWADRALAPRLSLATVLVCTGVCALFGTFIVDDLPELLEWIVLDPQLTAGGLLRTEFALAALCLLPATCGMGAVFPLTLRAVVGSAERVGLAVGRAYAINTIGAIGGSFAAVFILIPLAGVEWGMRIAAAAYPVAAAVLAGSHRGQLHHGFKLALGGASAATLALALVWPSWDVGVWTSGVYRLSMTRAYEGVQDLAPPEIIYHRDGLAATVTVEQADGDRWIKVDGKTDGSSSGDMPTQILSGVLPMTLHPAPEEVAVIGCGTCVTVGAALQAEPERVALVEIEPAVLEAARLFGDVNYKPWTDPRLRVVADDGRNYLMRTNKRFDVIISEPSNPWMSGAAKLFTKEFFAIAQRRLARDGMFLQWLQAYELSGRRIASVLKTFHAAFPHVLVFTPHVDSNDLLLVGTNTRLQPTWETLNERFEQLRTVYQQAELSHPGELASRLLFSQQRIAALPDRIPLNTDDNGLIEFGAPLDLVHFAESDADLSLLFDHPGEHAELAARWLDPSHPEWAGHMLQVVRGYLEQGMLAEARRGLTLIQADLGASGHHPSAATSQSQAAKRGEQSPQSDLSTASSRALREQMAAFRALIRRFQEPDARRVLSTELVRDAPELTEATETLLEAPRRAGAKAALSVLADSATETTKDPAKALMRAYLLYRAEYYWRAEEAFKDLKALADSPEIEATATYYQARNDFGRGAYGRALRRMHRFREMNQHNLPPAANND